MRSLYLGFLLLLIAGIVFDGTVGTKVEYYKQLYKKMAIAKVLGANDSDSVFLDVKNQNISVYTDEEKESIIAKTMELECILAEKYGLECDDVIPDDVMIDSDVVYAPKSIDRMIQNAKAYNVPRDAAKERYVRNMVDRPGLLWNTRVLPYVFDKTVLNNLRVLARIKEAMSIYERNTCVRFKRKSYEDYFLYFTAKGYWCSAYGSPYPDRSGEWHANWTVTLANSECTDQVGTSWHEIAHVLGKHHEHMRPDRDDHVQIIPKNIRKGKLRQFTPPCTEWCYAEVPYDYGSAMHYADDNKFVINNASNIVTNDPVFMDVIGSRYPGPSFYDLKAINLAYDCEEAMIARGCRKLPQCINGGYPHPVYCGWCMCPHGFADRLCERVESAKPCGGEFLASDDWQNFTTRNYPDFMVVESRCTWLLRAAVGQQVEFKFNNQVFNFRDSKRCERSFVEVRYKKDLANTGPRYCRNSVPQRTFVSETEQLLVLVRHYEDKERYRGFSGQFRIVPV